MHQDSFILLPCPSKTDGALFKVLGAFERKHESGDTEDVYILAFAARERNEIPAIVFHCFEQHLHMQPTTENVVHAAIFANCSRLLTMRPDGSIPTEERTADICKKFNININRYDILFLGGRGGNMEVLKAHLASIMPAR